MKLALARYDQWMRSKTGGRWMLALAALIAVASLTWLAVSPAHAAHHSAPRVPACATKAHPANCSIGGNYTVPLKPQRQLRTRAYPCVTTTHHTDGYSDNRPFARAELTENTCGLWMRVKLEWVNVHNLVLGTAHSRWVDERQKWVDVDGSQNTYVGDAWVSFARCRRGCTIRSKQFADLDDK